MRLVRAVARVSPWELDGEHSPWPVLVRRLGKALAARATAAAASSTRTTLETMVTTDADPETINIKVIEAFDPAVVSRQRRIASTILAHRRRFNMWASTIRRTRMPGLLDGKIAIVTGGTSGIGLATVERFVTEGAKVAIADIQDDLGRSIADRLAEHAFYVNTDVTDDSAIETLVAETVDRFGKLDIMYNNAGAQGSPAPILDTDANAFDETIALLTRSVLLGHKYAARQFQAQGTGGAIISTASAAGLQGGWSAAGYTIAKHAVLGVVRQAVAELAPLGIRSNAIAPGVIMTPIMARTFGVPVEESVSFTEFLAERLGHTQPLGRAGTADDVAKVATFLASDLSDYVTGVTIPVDGGATAVTQGTFSTDVVNAAEEYYNR